MMDEEDLSREAHARVGSTVGKYRLDSVLGVGGTAAVYAAQHRNGNRVAVKVLHLHYAANESMRARFLREGYVANKVDHPGTVRVLDDDTADNATYLVMDLLEGETLEARAERSGGALPPADVVHHGVALLDVLERAHTNGIVHRDLKPENLFLTTRSELKVLDFGIARLRDSTLSTTATQTGTMLGTPAYLAPEQALGHTDDIDARTDLWAAGATLFTLLTGRHVHLGRSAQEALVFAATQPAPPIQSIAPHVPDALAAVVDRALRFRREERWQNANEMRNALGGTGLARLTVAIGIAAPMQAGAASPPVSTIMTSSGNQRATSSMSHVALASALFGIVALAGIVGGLVLLRRHPHEPPPPVTEPAAANDEPEPEALPLPPPLPQEPSARPIADDAGLATVASTAPSPAPPPVQPGSPLRPTRPAKPPASTRDMWDPRSK